MSKGMALSEGEKLKLTFGQDSFHKECNGCLDHTTKVGGRSIYDRVV